MVKLTVPRTMMVLVATLLVAYAFLIGPRLTKVARQETAGASAANNGAKPSADATGARQVFPPDGKMFIGVLTKDGAHDFTEVD